MRFSVSEKLHQAQNPRLSRWKELEELQRKPEDATPDGAIEDVLSLSLEIRLGEFLSP